MKTFLPFLLLLCGALRLTAANPVPYTEAVSYSCRINGVGCGYVTVYGEAGGPRVGASTGTQGTVESEVATVWLRPGKSYNVVFDASGPGQYWLSFITPEGYQLYVDDDQLRDKDKGIGIGLPTNMIARSPGGAGYYHTYSIKLLPASGSGRADFSTFGGIEIGQSVTWDVGLGGLPDGGRSAGRIMFKEKDLTKTDQTKDPAKRARLYYMVPGNYGSLVVLRDGDSSQDMRQVLAAQGAVDLVDDDEGGYWMKFYAPDQVRYDSNVDTLATFVGAPWKTIRVQSAAANQLTITETEGVVSRVSHLELTSGTVSSGTYVWTLREGDGTIWSRTTTHTSTQFTDRREDVVAVRTGDATGTVVSKTMYCYRTPGDWGETLTRVVADPDGAALETIYDYYNDATAVGNFRKLKSMVDATGNWVAYQYYDDWDRRGGLRYEFHPYVNAPASVTLDPLQGRVVEYQYEADWTTRFNRLSLRQEKTNNVVTAKITRTNNDIPVVNGWWRESATTMSYRDENSFQTDYAEMMRGDAGSEEPGRPYLVRSANGVQSSWSRIKGTYVPATGVFSTTGGSSHYRELVVHGTWIGTGAESFTTWGGQSFGQIYLIANKSTMDASIYDSRGLLVRAETWVYTGGGAFSRMTAEDMTYDFAGRLLTRVSNGNTAVTNTIADGRLTSTIDGAGVETQFLSFDAIGRVVTAVKTGAPSVAATLASGYSYPAQGDISTTYTYDGAGHVLQQDTTGGALTQTSSRIFDLAGRLSSETAPGNFTTSYAYSPATRTVTVTVPGGGTKITTTYLDGQLFTVSGTAAVSEYVTYWVGQEDKRKACQRTLGGFSDAPTNLCWDWLGRQVEAWHPGWNGNYVGKYWDYNNQGQLVRVRQEGLADTLFAYDTLGQLSSQWLDVNGNGLLDAGGTDRITVSGWSFSKDANSNWFLNKTQSLYTQDNADTAVQVSKVSQQLSGLAAGRLATTVSSDVYGNTSSSYVDVDRANKKLTSWSQLSSATMTPQSITYNGLLMETRDQTGVVMRYEYDALGRPIKSIDPRTGATTTAYQNGSNLVDTITDPNNVVQATYSYDAAGRVAKITNGLRKVERYAYSTLGQLIQQWGDTTSPIEYGYDAMGRRTTMKTYRAGTGWTGPSATAWPAATTGTADVTTWSYHPATGLLQNKIDAGGRQVNYTYTQAGQLASRTWARGVTTTYTYSPTTAELTNVSYSDSTPALVHTYNRLGQLATVNDATGLRTFNFNSAATLELQSEALPAYFNSRQLTYGYDTATGVKGRLNAFGLGYAGNGYSEQSVSYGFSTVDARLTSITANSYGNTAATYDIGYLANSHLVEQVSQPTAGYTDVRTYNSEHDWVETRNTTRNTQSGESEVAGFQYYRDSIGRVRNIYKQGELFRRYFDGSDKFVVLTTLGYSSRSEVTSETTDLLGSGSFEHMLGRSDTYGFDNIGNRLSTSHNGSTATYAPDSLNQYTSRTVPGVFDVAGAAAEAATVTINGTAAPRQSEYFFKGVTLNNTSAAAYTSLVISDGTTSANLPAYLPKALQEFTYDLDGNLTGDGRWTYTYDAENRMIGMVTADAAVTAGVPKQRFTFTNDYLGRRVQKLQQTWNGTAWVDAKKERFIYRGWELAAVVNGSGTLLRSFFWGIDAGGAMGSASGSGGAGGLLMIQEGGQSYLPAYDAMGNLHALTKASDGSLAAAYEYDAFGNTLRESGAYAGNNPFRYATKYTDVETSLIYYGLRYYNPSLGRFNNRDPLEERGGANLYSFGHNSPSNRWDVLGLDDDDESGGGSGGGFWSWITGRSGPGSSRSSGRNDDGGNVFWWQRAPGAASNPNSGVIYQSQFGSCYRDGAQGDNAGSGTNTAKPKGTEPTTGDTTTPPGDTPKPAVPNAPATDDPDLVILPDFVVTDTRFYWPLLTDPTGDPNSGAYAANPSGGDTSLMGMPPTNFGRNYPYAKAYVLQNGNDVTIYAPVVYRGPTATDANIAKFESSITKYWTGKFGGYNTSVVFMRGGYQKDGYTFATGVYMADAGTARSCYSTQGVILMNTANWTDSTPAHEFGHFMGSPEGYREGTWEALPGWENNIMGPALERKVEEINIKNAIERWGGFKSNGFVAPGGK